MAITFLQKVRLWWRGSQRRREDFVAQNTNWGPSPGLRPPSPRERGEGPRVAASIDREGLQAAYLDQSGAILYYLDLDSGEVVESATELTGHYARVPTQDDAADRAAFLIAHPMKTGDSFRAAIAQDRAL